MERFRVLDPDTKDTTIYESVEALERYLVDLPRHKRDRVLIYDDINGDGPYKAPSREYLLHQIQKYGCSQKNPTDSEAQSGQKH